MGGNCRKRSRHVNNQHEATVTDTHTHTHTHTQTTKKPEKERKEDGEKGGRKKSSIIDFHPRAMCDVRGHVIG